MNRFPLLSERSLFQRRNLDGGPGFTLPTTIVQNPLGLADGAVGRAVAGLAARRALSGTNFRDYLVGGDTTGTLYNTSGLNGVDPRLYSKFVYPNGYPALTAAPPYAYGRTLNFPYQTVYPNPYAYPYNPLYPYPYGPGYGYTADSPVLTTKAQPYGGPIALKEQTGWRCARYPTTL